MQDSKEVPHAGSWHQHVSDGTGGGAPLGFCDDDSLEADESADPFMFRGGE
jgi:hypothetical protein